MKKKLNLDDVSPEARKIALAVIRTYCKVSGLYSEANKRGIGLDECEETVKELIESGILIIVYNEEADTITIELSESYDL